MVRKRQTKDVFVLKVESESSASARRTQSRSRCHQEPGLQKHIMESQQDSEEWFHADTVWFL